MSDPDELDAEWTWLCRYLPRLDPMWGLIPPPRAPHLPDGTSAHTLLRWLREHPADAANRPPNCALVEEELGLICTDAYAPSRRLRSRVVERDQTCRFPTCRVPAWRCQLDHIVPFDDSLPAWAQTVETNLHALCTHHHQVKTATIFTVERDPRTGITTWHAPTGHVYTRAPEHADYTAIGHHLRDDYAMTICEEESLVGLDDLPSQTVPAGADVDADVHRWLPESTAPASSHRASWQRTTSASTPTSSWPAEPPF